MTMQKNTNYIPSTLAIVRVLLLLGVISSTSVVVNCRFPSVKTVPFSRGRRRDELSLLWLCSAESTFEGQSSGVLISISGDSL